jgi:hypothetical protein
MSALDNNAQQTATTTRSGRNTKARQHFVPGSKSSKGECWGVGNQPGDISQEKATASQKELEDLGNHIYYDILKTYYGWTYKSNKSLSGPTWDLFNPKVPSKERVENISQFTAGYEAVAARFKENGANIEEFLTSCGHDPAHMARKIEDKNKKRKERTTTTSSADEDDDDESTLAMMEDGSSSSSSQNGDETNPVPTTTRRVRRDPPAAARVSLSPSSGGSAARRGDAPVSGETTEERFEKMEQSLKTVMGRVHELEKTVEDLKAGH